MSLIQKTFAPCQLDLSSKNICAVSSDREQEIITLEHDNEKNRFAKNYVLSAFYVHVWLQIN